MSTPFASKDQAVHDMLYRMSQARGTRPAFLTPVQADALRLFMEDYEVAHVDWSKDTEQRDRMVDLETVLSDTTYRFLTVFFGEGWGLEQTEKECGVPARSGRVIMRIAAEYLVPYYELE